MVVIAILGILAALIVPKIMSRPDEARRIAAKQDIGTMMQSLNLYRLDNGRYPVQEQGLTALVQKPATDPVPNNWKDGGYLERLPKDPWGNPYQYLNRARIARSTCSATARMANRAARGTMRTSARGSDGVRIVSRRMRHARRASYVDGLHAAGDASRARDRGAAGRGRDARAVAQSSHRSGGGGSAWRTCSNRPATKRRCGRSRSLGRRSAEAIASYSAPKAARGCR